MNENNIDIFKLSLAIDCGFDSEGTRFQEHVSCTFFYFTNHQTLVKTVFTVEEIF